MIQTHRIPPQQTRCATWHRHAPSGSFRCFASSTIGSTGTALT